MPADYGVDPRRRSEQREESRDERRADLDILHIVRASSGFGEAGLGGAGRRAGSEGEERIRVECLRKLRAQKRRDCREERNEDDYGGSRDDNGEFGL